MCLFGICCVENVCYPRYKSIEFIQIRGSIMKKMITALAFCALTVSTVGQVQAQTPTTPPPAQPTVLGTTGLTAGTVAAIVGGVLVLGVLIGGGDDTTTTTTTTTP